MQLLRATLALVPTIRLENIIIDFVDYRRVSYIETIVN